MDNSFSMIDINDLINNACDKKCENKDLKNNHEENGKTDFNLTVIKKINKVIIDDETSKKSKKEKYNQNTYNDNFMLKHKDKLKERIECEICGGSYTYYNKSTHNKSIRHNKMKQRLNM